MLNLPGIFGDEIDSLFSLYRLSRFAQFRPTIILRLFN